MRREGEVGESRRRDRDRGIEREKGEVESEAERGKRRGRESGELE